MALSIKSAAAPVTKGGNYSLYMPSSQIKGGDTRFLRPVPEQTLTIPSTAERVITVGAPTKISRDVSASLLLIVSPISLSVLKIKESPEGDCKVIS